MRRQLTAVLMAGVLGAVCIAMAGAGKGRCRCRRGSKTWEWGSGQRSGRRDGDFGGQLWHQL